MVSLVLGKLELSVEGELVRPDDTRVGAGKEPSSSDREDDLGQDLRRVRREGRRVGGDEKREEVGRREKVDVAQMVVAEVMRGPVSGSQ